MSKITAPTVAIELDKTRHLKLDLNAMAAFEEAAGQSMFTLKENMSARHLRALLWAALLHEDRELTLEQVGAMIHASNMEYIGGKIKDVFENSMPKGGGDPGKNQKRPIG